MFVCLFLDLFGFFFFFWPYHTAYGILVPLPGIEPAPHPSAVEARSLNHWTTREVPSTVNLEERTMEKKNIENCAVKIKSSIREKYTTVIIDVCALKRIVPILYYSLYLVFIQWEFIPVQLSCVHVCVCVCVCVCTHLCIFISFCNL